MPVGEEQQATDINHVEVSLPVATTPSRVSRHDHTCQADALTTNESSSKANEKPSGLTWWSHILRKQFRYEARKALRLQLDCGLYGGDWRIIYGGSSVRYFGPSLMLALRASAFITHLTVLLVTEFYDDMLFFTTWTNLVALAFLFTSTLLSIASVGSLSRECRKREESLGGTTCRTPVACLDRAEAQYALLVRNQNGDGNIRHPSTERTLPPLRRCLDFRRPFSGFPRMIILETLQTSGDVATAMTLPMVAIMFFVYWTLLFPLDGSSKLWIAIYFHLFAPVASWMLAGLSRFPYRLSLLSVFLFTGVCYLLMIIILQRFGIGFVYWFLNFRKRPGLAAGVSLVLILICGPLVACLSWMALLLNTVAVDPAGP